MRLVLFDIDGTLLLSGGAGGRALHKALQQNCGVENGMQGVRPFGKTDPQIIREALKRSGKEEDFSKEHLECLFTDYLSLLREEIANSAQFRVLPGARELVSILSRREDWLPGLATGNIEGGAQMKLERAGLSSFFSFGGYGSDAENRADVIRTAIQRGLEVIVPATAEAIFVIGDTPRDIVHAKEVNVRTVAVATGNYSLSMLRAYRPDLVVESLSPIEPILEFLDS